MRYCGIDVSASAANQQLCTLHERRGTHTQLEAQGEEPVELVATFYVPGDVASVARTVLGFGGEAVAAVDAPSGAGVFYALAAVIEGDIDLGGLQSRVSQRPPATDRAPGASGIRRARVQ